MVGEAKKKVASKTTSKPIYDGTFALISEKH